MSTLTYRCDCGQVCRRPAAIVRVFEVGRAIRCPRGTACPSGGLAAADWDEYVEVIK